jgi:uncharacterized cupin superfamily protein
MSRHQAVSGVRDKMGDGGSEMEIWEIGVGSWELGVGSWEIEDNVQE